jgi:hypothetical protein
MVQPSSPSNNPLLQVILQSIKSLKHLKVGEVIDFIVNFPHNYEVWWIKLFKESPQHVFIETALILFIIWLVFLRKTVDPKKTKDSDKLSSKEIDWLIETWQPEPLVPELNEKEAFVVNQYKVSLFLFFLRYYGFGAYCLCN